MLLCREPERGGGGLARRMVRDDTRAEVREHALLAQRVREAIRDKLDRPAATAATAAATIAVSAATATAAAATAATTTAIAATTAAAIAAAIAAATAATTAATAATAIAAAATTSDEAKQRRGSVEYLVLKALEYALFTEAVPVPTPNPNLNPNPNPNPNTVY